MPIIEVFYDGNYLKELDKRLNEEVAEYQVDKSLNKWQILSIVTCNMLGERISH